MKQILLAVYQSKGGDSWSLAEAYQTACYDQVLQGGEVDLDSAPLIVGRAVEKSSFVNHLKLNTDYFSTKRQAQDFVERLVAADLFSESEQTLPMSKYAAWVTWDEERSDNDPFGFAKGNADYIRASLGLDPEGRCRGGLLLLTYNLQKDCSLIRPTIADAGLSLFFQPPPIGFDAHGWTRPWSFGVEVKDASLPHPRPEAVHRPQTMRSLREHRRLLQ